MGHNGEHLRPTAQTKGSPLNVSEEPGHRTQQNTAERALCQAVIHSQISHAVAGRLTKGNPAKKQPPHGLPPVSPHPPKYAISAWRANAGALSPQASRRSSLQRSLRWRQSPAIASRNASAGAPGRSQGRRSIPLAGAAKRQV
jgi:hypothetical protein